MTRSILRQRVAGAAVACVVALVLGACGGQAGGASGQVLIDGSSTVAPLSTAASELFRQQNPNANVPVATSGTGGGFDKFCSGAIDISNASRPIGEDEIAACRQNGIEYTELQVANDALTVVVNPQNGWANCLTAEELNRIWGPQSEGQVTNWSQVRPGFPDVPLQLFGPGTDSGTFDYFTEAVNGEEGASRADYAASEDDNLLVQGVQGAPGATAYFGFTYFEENQDALKAVAVDGGEGCTAPSAQTVQDGTYKPLARPLFIYVSNAAYAEKPQVRAFVDFYAENIQQIAEAAQYVPLNEQQQQRLAATVSGLGA